jgi:lipoprotein-anchoring transpeptidase ErfK/SrfK
MRKAVPALVIGMFALVTACSAVAGAGPQRVAETSSLTFAPPVPTLSAPSTPPSTTTTTPPPSVAPCAYAVACVSLSTKRAWLVRDGEVVFGPVPIMPGKAGQETPVGKFRVAWKDQEHYSSEFDGMPMPNSVFFAAGGVAFHAGSLQEGSHGCVHLSDADSLKFFESLKVGDPVEVQA